MTRRTARQKLRAAKRLYLAVDLFLLVCGDVRRIPCSIEDFGRGPDVRSRIPVARETPFHLERVLLINRRHVRDITVARGATDTLSDVDAVIEIDVFGKVVDADPLNRFVVTVTGPDRLEVRTVCPNLGMTVHTGLCWGHTRRSGGLDRGVTITAIDTVVTDMVFVAELDWLGSFGKYVG